MLERAHYSLESRRWQLQEPAIYGSRDAIPCAHDSAFGALGLEVAPVEFVLRAYATASAHDRAPNLRAAASEQVRDAPG